VDLQGVLAQLFRLGFDHTGRAAVGRAGAGNKKAAPGGAADLQLELVAGAGYNEERTARELKLAV